MKTLDWSITLPSNGIPVSYKIDSGAQFNFIPLTILRKFDPESNLSLVNIKLSTYNNKTPIVGKSSLILKHKKDHFDILFIVVNSISVPILGLSTSESLNLLKCISVIKASDKFPDCFGQVGTLTFTDHCGIKDNVTPVATPVRKIPVALKPKIETELKHIVDLDIIEPVQKPTDWDNGLVIVEKPK